MKAFFIFFNLSFAIVVSAFSQNSFIKQYGGTNLNDYGSASDMLETFDSSYVIYSSYQENNISATLQIMKTDTSGNLIWGKKITPASGYYMAPSTVLQTSDSGFIITGRINYAFSDENIFYLKLNKNGDLIWSKFLSTSMHDYGEKVIETNDGGYLIVGTFYNDPVPNTGTYLIKTDVMGNLIWAKNYGGGQWGGYLNIEQNPDNSYTMIGKDYTGISILHLDVNGILLSNQQLILPLEVNSVMSLKTSDGGHIIAGRIDSTVIGPYPDVYLMKLDSTDSVMWCKKFSTTNWEMPFSLRSTSDGGFIFTVFTYNAVLHTSILFRLNSAGDTLWTKSFDNSALYTIIQDHSGNYIAAGRMYNTQPVQTTLIKIDSSGSTTCPVSCLQYNESPMSYQYASPVIGSNTPSFDTLYVALTVNNFSAQNDYCLPASIHEEKEQLENITGRFNGNTLELTYLSFEDSPLDISISDITGNQVMVKKGASSKGINKYSIETELAKGIYVVTLSSSANSLSIKVIQTD